jgi:hypothetical protein
MDLYCNGKLVTPRDVETAKTNILDAISEMRSSGFLPQDIPVNFTSAAELAVTYISEPNRLLGNNFFRDTFGNSFANYDTHILFNPTFFSCLNARQTKSMVAHEIGHYNDELMLIMNNAPFVLALIGVVAIERCYGLLKRLAGRNKKTGKSLRSEFVGLGKLLVAHTACAGIYLSAAQEIETRADSYSAYVMGSGTPLAEAFQNLQTMSARLNKNEAPPPRNESQFMYVLSEIQRYASYGVFAFFVRSPHPSTKERIQKLESYNSSEPSLPFGMTVPANWRPPLANRDPA